jgi:hypothetical protein
LFFHGEYCLHIEKRKSDRTRKRRENARVRFMRFIRRRRRRRLDNRRRDANRAESRDERVGESGFEAIGQAKRFEQGAGGGRRNARATRVELLGVRVDFFVTERGGAGS